MGFKTVLVHLGLDADCERRIRAAADFARRQDARLRGLFVTLPMAVPGVPVGASIPDALDIARTAAEPLHQKFEAICDGDGVRREWLLELGDPGEHLALHGRYADVIIIGQDQPSRGFADFHSDLVEYLPFAAGCPVVVLPAGRDSVIDPTDIAIAWKSSREAAIAVRGALPLLKEARTVTVLTVLPPGETQVQGAGLSRFLTEHGVSVEIRDSFANESGVGQMILDEAAAVGAGLIVMGVYGHNRLRTRILGGVSRHVLKNATVPVLVAH